VEQLKFEILRVGGADPDVSSLGRVQTNIFSGQFRGWTKYWATLIIKSKPTPKPNYSELSIQSININSLYMIIQLIISIPQKLQVKITDL